MEVVLYSVCTYIYIYIYVCVCVFVGFCAWVGFFYVGLGAWLHIMRLYTDTCIYIYVYTYIIYNIYIEYTCIHNT